MRKSIVALTVVAVLLTASLSAAAAPFSGTIVGGVRTHASDVEPYIYLEGSVLDNLAVGVDYHRKHLALSVWLGWTRGFYGEVQWTNGFTSKPQSAELGLWSQFNVADRAVVYGWVGAKRQATSPAITRLSLNAEAQVPLSGAVYAVVGGSADFGQNVSDFNGWLGLGYQF